MAHSQVRTKTNRTQVLIVNTIAYLCAILPSLLLIYSPSLFHHFPLLCNFLSPLCQPSIETYSWIPLPIRLTFIGDLFGTLVIYLISFIVGNSSMYDAYWSVAPPFIFLAYSYFIPVGIDTGRKVLVGISILLWSVRLTWNCFRRWEGLHEEDWRYSDYRPYGKIVYWVVSFLGFHLFPTLIVFNGCVSIYVALVVGTEPLNWIDYLALGLSIFATLLQLISDSQMNEFNRIVK